MSAASTPVPFVDLARQNEPIVDELAEAVAAAVERGDFILGEAVGLFEAEFAAHAGAEFAVGVGSGTAALMIACLAAGIGPGDEVIVPAHTYIASALGVVHTGAIPVFCDVDRGSGLIDLDSAAAVVGPKTAAILPVHLYGRCCDMEAVADFAGKHGLAVIEDAAQAHGARWGESRAGSFGTAAAFSFYPSKNLGALGDGGIVLTSDEQVATAARRLRNLGQEQKGEHLVIGFNERLDTLQAAALRVKLRCLDLWNSQRRDAADAYRSGLPDEAPTLVERDGGEDVWHLMPVLLEHRERVRDQLGERGIQTGYHYSPAVHRQPPFADEPANREGAFPEAERWAAMELSLPMFAGLSDAEVGTVCSALAEATATAGT